MDILDKIKLYLKEDIAFNQVNPCNSIYFSNTMSNFGEYKISELLRSFNCEFIEIDEYPTIWCNPIKTWKVLNTTIKEMFMKFGAIGFNPPGGKAIQKNVMQFGTIWIFLYSDITDLNNTYIYLINPEDLAGI